jgi:hypothetical protein
LHNSPQLNSGPRHETLPLFFRTARLHVVVGSNTVVSSEESAGYDGVAMAQLLQAAKQRYSVQQLASPGHDEGAVAEISRVSDVIANTREFPVPEAERTERICYGLEIEPRYVDVHGAPVAAAYWAGSGTGAGWPELWRGGATATRNGNPSGGVNAVVRARGRRTRLATFFAAAEPRKPGVQAGDRAGRSL